MPPVNAVGGRQFRYAALSTALGAHSCSLGAPSAAVACSSALGRDLALLFRVHRGESALRASSLHIRHVSPPAVAGPATPPSLRQFTLLIQVMTIAQNRVNRTPIHKVRGVALSVVPSLSTAAGTVASKRFSALAMS